MIVVSASTDNISTHVPNALKLEVESPKTHRASLPQASCELHD